MKMQLDRDWRLTCEDISCEPADAYKVMRKQEDWLPVPTLPCDIRMPLIEQGRIPEPLVADHSFASEWTETKSWWFAKSFEVADELLAQDRVQLHMESLDAEADVWLNGVHLGHHRSAFHPFTREVKAELLAGSNELLVRVTSGLEHITGQAAARTADTIQVLNDEGGGKRGDRRRANVRKAQFSYGWDWGPRVATCGIVGSVRLEAEHRVLIRNVSAVTTSVNGTDARLRFEVEAENLHAYVTREARLSLALRRADGSPAGEHLEDVCLRSGVNYFTFELEVVDARLWWPNGMGDQPLYSVQASLTCGDAVSRYPDFKLGIRTIRLNTDRWPSSGNEPERQFTFEVNGVPVFCKGGNWIPADLIVARVSDEKYDTLVREAREANFNMLRVWGGGVYERETFYEKCDEYGILIWHDFMFACAKYPDHLDWFREESTQEIDYQTKRLRNHASMALWCGNNENHWAFDEGWNDTRHPQFYGGAAVYNIIAPELIRRNCPEIPYWNSSPYGGEHPNGNAMGDRHHWFDAMMNPSMERRITPEVYDEVEAKFVSEYGYIGPCRRSSIETYLGDEPIDMNSRIWRLHTNIFEKETVRAGIRKHYTEREALTLDEYLLYAGLCQGTMYGYSLESMRGKPFCSGALFWMYNDCWGEIGWSIVDYYLRRKLSYYAVKRAFAPLKLIVREQGDMAEVTAVNETDVPVAEVLECGFLSFDGSVRRTDRTEVSIPARFRGVVHRFPTDRNAGGLNAAIPILQPERIHPGVLRPGDIRELALPEAGVRLTAVRRDGDNLAVTLVADTYAHAVHWDLSDRIRLSDHYFDLLPGESRTIAIFEWPDEALPALRSVR